MSNVAVERGYEVEASPTAKRKTEIRIMKGIGASSGVAVGPCRVITRPEDLNLVKTGEILVFPTASPCLVPVMRRLRGLVAEVGGRLTIAAHHAREYGIPHVAGVSDVMAAVTDGRIIRIDGSKGTVSLL
jgi:pyruvate, water dikinase